MVPNLPNRPPPEGAHEADGDGYGQYDDKFIESGHRCLLSVMPPLNWGRLGFRGRKGPTLPPSSMSAIVHFRLGVEWFRPRRFRFRRLIMRNTTL
jgi:hypothetical protein